MRIKDYLRKGLGTVQSISRGYGSTLGNGAYGFAGQSSGRDWNREAGVRYDNSIVFSAIMYAWNALTEVDLVVRTPKSDGTHVESKTHPAIDIIQNPNPWYDGASLMSGWAVSELAGPGYSCTYKHRSSAGRVVALEYVPHFSIFPFCNPGSGNFIDHFQLTVSGGYQRIDPRNILMQRFGPMDPRRPQTCIGPLLAALLEVVTDKQAANYTAALLSNVGITPHLISPNMRDGDGQEIVFETAQINQIKQAFEDKITGDNRGRPLIMPLPIKVDSLSFSPSDMNLEGIRNISEERICAALGIHPLAMYLGTALEQSNNRASAGSAFTQSARSFNKPYLKRKSQQLTRDLGPELLEPGEYFWFRSEDIEALQEDKTETAKRNQIEVGGPYKTANEKRKELGLPPIEGGDVLVSRGTSKPKEDDDEERQDQRGTSRSLVIGEVLSALKVVAESQNPQPIQIHQETPAQPDINLNVSLTMPEGQKSSKTLNIVRDEAGNIAQVVTEDAE